MAEFVQHHKEKLITEVPLLQSHFKKSTLKKILNQREKYEYRIMRRNKQKSDFTHYIVFLKSVNKKVKKMGSQNNESLKLIGMHNKRIISIYNSALKYFKDDVSLWKEYIQFLIEAKRIGMLSTVIDKALLLHGQISDELYVFALKQEFSDLKNIQKTRELYTSGLHVHKNSSALYLEAFKCELAYSKILTKKVLKTGKELNLDDPTLNGSIAQVIFESAVENVKNDFNVFFKMHKEATEYEFALNLSKEIKNFMLTTFCMDPNYWDTLATNQLSNNSLLTEKLRIKKCLDLYDEALSVIDTDEMWDKYLNSLLKLTSDSDNTETYKRDLLKYSMYNAHQKKKMKPIHYVKWINKSTSSMTEEILNCAVEVYPNDTSILEEKLKYLVDTDKLSAYELFKQNSSKVSVSIWCVMIKCFSTEPQLKDIFDMAFGDKSVCANKVKQKLGNKYLRWLYENTSLNEARNAYNKLIINSDCNANLYKTIVSIEIKCEQIDIPKIRQHFMWAGMQFGKTNIDLWLDRIYFELKYGSPRLVSSTYHQALTNLNNTESDKFVETYALNAHRFNQL